MVKDRPVFFDASGKRWARLRATMAILLLGLLSFLAITLPPLLAPEAQLTSSFDGKKRDQIAKEIVEYVHKTNVAVVGNGPFVRVVATSPSGGPVTMRDPFSGAYLGMLSEQDSLAVENMRYTIQRFGDGNNKQIALTFDDGPDARYTPELLDLLSRESARATFFVVGANATKHPELVQRIAREGHDIGNHTFNHINFDLENDFRAHQEIIQTGRVVRAMSGDTMQLFRSPYMGENEQSLRDDIASLTTTQKLGYTMAGYTFDTLDWQFTSNKKPVLPNFTGTNNITALVHDGGGNREKTVAYVADFIKQAKAHGYSFVPMSQMYDQPRPHEALATSHLDVTSLAVANSVLVWPAQVIIALFVFSVFAVFATSVVNTILAHINYRRLRKLSENRRTSRRKVGVIIPAYNEGIVLEKTVQSISLSKHKNLEIVLIDDGSTDDTWQVMQGIARKYSNVIAIHQANTGKSGALNNAISQINTSVVVCLDADTVFTPDTIGNLVRHFKDKRVGAVAGTVKVGNVQNIITRWQALEYTIGITLERNSHALMNSIMIVPGACGAWRRKAIIKAGGFSHRTLAEDCDLTLALQEQGYKIIQDNTAISYTEAPSDIRSLMKQRFRWTFGNFQALWVHRDMLFTRHHKMLGNFVMPLTVVAIVIPLVFWPVLIMLAVENVLSGNYLVIAAFFVASLFSQFIFAFMAVRLSGENYRLLWALPFARFVFGPIRTYILYRSLLVSFKGRYVGWNKLLRSNSVEVHPSVNTTLTGGLTQ